MFAGLAAFLARWKLWALAGAVVGAAGYVGALHVNLASERAVTARLNEDLVAVQGQYAQCDARLQNILERIDSDATVPDDLGGFRPPSWWMLPGLDGPDHTD